jgi:hypothetical protein
MTETRDTILAVINAIRRKGLSGFRGAQCVMLTGSANAGLLPDSDLDLLVVSDDNRWLRSVKIRGGVHLDLFVHGQERLLNELETGTLDSLIVMYSRATHLYGDEALSLKLVETAKVRLAAGRPLSRNEQLELLETTQAIARKAKRETDPARRQFLVGMLGTHLIRAAVNFRGGWLPEPSRVLDVLAGLDEPCHRCFIQMFENATNDAIELAMSSCLRLRAPELNQMRVATERDG